MTRRLITACVLAGTLTLIGCDDGESARPRDVLGDGGADLALDTTPADTLERPDAVPDATDATDDDFADACDPTVRCCECQGACQDRCTPCGECFDDCVCPTSQVRGDFACRPECTQRDTMACLDLDGDDEFTCWRRCDRDADCPNDLFCDVSSGICTPDGGCPLPLCHTGPLTGSAPCDPTCSQPQGTECVDLNGDGVSRCYQAHCDPFFDPGCDDPPPECDGFFDDADCPADQKCTPTGWSSGLCTDNGPALEGDDCTSHADCADGLLCGGTCFAPECAPLTGDPGCPGPGEVCEGFSIGSTPIDIGLCITPCDPFARDADGAPQDACGPPGDGAACVPNDIFSDEYGTWGSCRPASGGSAGPGDPCDDAAPATTCGDTDGGFAPLVCQDGICLTICDRDAPTGCPGDDQGCFTVTGSARGPQWGVCDHTCAPSWDPDDVGVGCESGAYCWPAFEDAELGRCQLDASGMGRTGDACDVETRTGCDDLHVCLTTQTDDAGNALAAECTRLCAPSADADEPGHCADAPDGQQRTCLAVRVDDGQGGHVPLPVGTCEDTCDVTDLANRGCTPAEDGSPRTCQVGALFGIPEADLCTSGPATPLPLDGDCTAAGLEELDFCKDNGVCLDANDDGTLTCSEVCAPVGAAMPPQCSRPGASCDRLFQDVGVCQP